MTVTSLVFELSGPMQSWGVVESGDRRPTALRPSKSGVVGLVAASLGRDRDDSLCDLYSLAFGVRVDDPGVVVTDFHTYRRIDKVAFDTIGEALHGYPLEPKFAQSSLTRREYLSDAVFTVALSGESSLLEEISAALKAPVFTQYLGRRGCPPEPIRPSVVDNETPAEALAGVPRSLRATSSRTGALLPIYVDEDGVHDGERHSVQDVHALRKGWNREFASRTVRSAHVDPDSNFRIIGL